MAPPRIFRMSVAKVYPLYLTKVEKKGRTKAELDAAIQWLTGFEPDAVAAHLEAETSFEDFFAAATLPPNAHEVRGVVCGVRVEEVEDPLMRQIRMLDKLVDELARGKELEKVLRR